MANTFVNAECFFFDIERMTKGGSTYLDAVVRWCQDRSLEIEVGAELIEMFPLIKARLTLEAESLSLLKEKYGRLDLE